MADYHQPDRSKLTVRSPAAAEREGELDLKRTPDEHPLSRLQGLVGNAQVARMLAEGSRAGTGAPVQRAAEEDELQMMRDPAVQRAAEEDELQMMRDPAVQRAGEEDELQMMRDPAVQRAGEEDELQMMRDPAVQRSAGHDTAPEVGLEGGPVSDGTAARIQSRRGSGSPLADGVRARMESSLNADFGDVRLHTDGESAQLNQKLGAKAFTTGNDIFMGQGASPGDQGLLAHELTHVVQQRTMSSSGPMTVGPDGDHYEQQANSMASAVTSGAAAQRTPGQAEADE